MNIELYRLAELKSKLIEYARNKKYKAIHDKVLSTVFAGEKYQLEAPAVDPASLQPEEYYNFLDWFAIELRHEDDKTILDHFIEEHKGVLSAGDIDMMDKWRNVFESVFKIKNTLEDGFYAINLLNLKAYILKPTVPIEELAGVEKDIYITARVVPFRDYHVISGAMLQLNFESPNDAISYITDIIIEQPGLYFQDNSEGLEAAFKIQASERELFIDHFGDDIFVAEGSNIKKYFDEFHQKSLPMVKKMRDEFKRNTRLEARHKPAEAMEDIGHGFEAILDEYSGVETVGVIYDQVEGLNFFPDFKEFESVFSGDTCGKEEDISGENQNAIIKSYIENEKISPLPFMRMFERYADNAMLIFSGIFDFNPKGFDYKTDFEKYLFPFKSYFYRTKPVPSLLPVELEDFVSEVISG